MPEVSKVKVIQSGPLASLPRCPDRLHLLPRVVAELVRLTFERRAIRARAAHLKHGEQSG